MTTPAPVTSVTVTTDKPNYSPNDPITVTVEYPDPDNPGTTLTVTATVTAPSGTTATGSATATVGATPAVPLPVAVTDSLGGVYTQQTNEAGTAVFAGTVGTPPAGA